MSFLSSCCFWSLLLLPLTAGFRTHTYPEIRTHYTTLRDVPSNYTGYLLPTNLKPSWYRLYIAPNLTTNTYVGVVNITFDVVVPTDVITLHLNNDFITLLNTTTVTASENVTIVNVTYDSTHELVKFQLSSNLNTQNNCNINMSFEGKLGSNMLGFYLSTYKTPTANHSLAVTQFESTYARRAFPCFDEPKYRANFSIQILRPANLNSMSNMELKNSLEVSGIYLDVYKTTPSMPTYLVAFGVSDLANITDEKKFRVFARADVLNEADYTMSIGQNILEDIGTFVGVEYPLEKMDVVAVPDFDAGAMENWGLTTYREKYVLYNQRLNSWKEKFAVLSVVAHEFGHQWFGDLVTPERWDYAWLNEAFATYFEYTVSNRLEPSWNMGSAPYVMWAVQDALARDIDHPRPMTSAVYTPDQISDEFDYVIYQKGGSILRMTENFLTTPVWRKGLAEYLKANAYQTGTPEELFSALQSESSDVNTVNETLQGWTTQPGYPLITIMPTNSSANSTVTVFNITQTPYSMNATYSWNIPLRYTTQSELQFNASLASLQWLLPSDANTWNISINETGWIIFNVDQVGFYRVNYDANNWMKLKNQLQTNFTAIGRINRAQILDDAFHLGRTGHLDFHKVIGLSRYLPSENDIAPWNAFFVHMRFLMKQFQDALTGVALKKYAQSIVSSPFTTLVSNSTQTSSKFSNFSSALTVQYLASFACEVGLPLCEDFALREFKLWRQNITTYTILPELKPAVLCTALRKDLNVSVFKDVWNYLLNSNNGAEQLTLMNALGCVANSTYIPQFLDYVTDTNASYIRLQDRWIVFRALASNPAIVSPLLNYITTNFNRTSNALGSDIGRVMTEIGHSVPISEPNQVSQVEKLVADPTTDKKLQDLLNTKVLPAVYKRQNWTVSQPAATLKKWAHCYLSSSRVSAALSLYLILIALLLSGGYC